jgi:hypothetical protein
MMGLLSLTAWWRARKFFSRGGHPRMHAPRPGSLRWVIQAGLKKKTRLASELSNLGNQPVGNRELAVASTAGGGRWMNSRAALAATRLSS